MLGIELFRSTRHLALRAFAVTMPAAMAFAVVATANHYVLDVLAGALAVCLAPAVVTRLERSRVAPPKSSVRRRQIAADTIRGIPRRVGGVSRMCDSLAEP